MDFFQIYPYTLTKKTFVKNLVPGTHWYLVLNFLVALT